MHRCLLVAEVWRRIVEEAETTSSLAALARTCRAFKDTALDILWCNQRGLENIIKCISPDVLEERPGDVVPLLYFKRPLRDSDLYRFDFYAPRIKVLLDQFPYFCVAPSEDLLCVLSRYRRSPLLPNLYRIECGHLLGDSGNLYLWSLLLSHNLRDFCIQTADDETAASALTHLRLLSPHLRSITICLQFGGEAPYTLSALSDALLHLTELSWRLSLIENLALGARYDTSSNALTSLIPREKLVFRSLDRLTMHASSVFAACTAFVKRAQFPRLTHIILEIESEIVDDVDPLPFFKALYDSCSSPAAVTEVSFTDLGLSSSSVYTRHDTLNSYPAACFPKLADVKVKTPCGLALDDSAVKDIAVAWPQLSSLYS
ncbi:hypothetical protein A0H81_13154 [Grifola frondosa]|uniref:F-box domain-containing protein n=1 Tax=Grifola frondosa TaxID=5627 RepID=A0A1C7LPI7_GRIFR|nr:hypothetical protein A0H81_13154 [Grifola frondosa]